MIIFKLSFTTFVDSLKLVLIKSFSESRYLRVSKLTTFSACEGSTFAVLYSHLVLLTLLRIAKRLKIKVAIFLYLLNYYLLSTVHLLETNTLFIVNLKITL